MPDPAYDQLVSDAVSEIAESRGPIEQVKGMLMFVYRIDEQQAFGLLKWRSQETNVKLRALAVQLAADFLDLDYDENLPRRSSLDRLLMTAHLRASPAAGGCVQGTNVRAVDADASRPGRAVAVAGLRPCWSVSLLPGLAAMRQERSVARLDYH